MKIAEIIETHYENKQQRFETIKQVSSRSITNLRPSPSYLTQNNEEWPLHSSPSTQQNTSEKKISTKLKPTTQSHQSHIQARSIDSFIDLLEESKETAFSFNEDNLSMAQLLHWEFETRNWPAIE